LLDRKVPMGTASDSDDDPKQARVDLVCELLHG